MVTPPARLARSRPHTAVIIPALDEEESIGFVLDAIPRQSVDDVIVADNGSSDRTVEIALSRGARVVRAAERGYGAACLAGLAALHDQSELAVFLDADFSDDPAELPRLIAPIVDGRADMVIGTRTQSRDSRRALTFAQRWGNWLATRLIRLRWKYAYTDLGPFRAITRAALDRLAMSDRNFGWTVEMQIKAARAALRVHEVAVPYRVRVGRSKISGTVRGTILAGAKILYTIGRYAVCR